jgi:proteic killer suppression protein
MIQGFRCKETAKLFEGRFSRKFPRDIQQRALNKLRLIATVTHLETLKVPPSNHLEALRGGRKGQYSIRINQQWRICFSWKEGNAHHVEIVDYH